MNSNASHNIPAITGICFVMAQMEGNNTMPYQ